MLKLVLMACDGPPSFVRGSRLFAAHSLRLLTKKRMKANKKHGQSAKAQPKRLRG
jgi:hypothetical protein